MAGPRVFAFTLIAVLALAPLLGGEQSLAQPQQPQQPQRPQTPMPLVTPVVESPSPVASAPAFPTLPPPAPAPSAS